MTLLKEQYTKSEENMNMIQPYKISKISIYIFLFYVLLFVYLVGNKLIVLYGSILVATACILYEIVRNKEDVRSFCPYGVLVNIIMCLYSILVGIFIARDQSVLISTIKTYASFSIVCFDICYITKKEKKIEWLLDCIIILCIINSVYIILRGTFVSGYGYVLTSRQNPNMLGLMMDLGVFAIAYKAMRNTKNRIIYYCLALLFLYTIIQCGSRKCLISALIIGLFWFFTIAQQIWNRSIQAKVAVIIVILLLAVAIRYYYINFYINTYSYNRMEKLGSTVSGSSSQVRTLYYQFALDYFFEEPIFGIGLGQFAVWNPYHGYAHSTYAEALANWGFVGNAIYFIPMFWLGFKLLISSFNGPDKKVSKILLGLWIMEIFLGVGQIWFYEIEHMIAWTLAFLYYDMLIADNEKQNERIYKYVKTAYNDY